jgi:hypothetical protein
VSVTEDKRNKIDRRNFIKSIGAAGLYSIGAYGQPTTESNEPNAAKEEQNALLPQLPKRKLGKTGVEVPVLALGTNRLDNQVILRAALKRGIYYWDTAHSYMEGNSELTIGKFLAQNPQLREKLFIVSKASGAWQAQTPQAVVAEVQKRFETSLQRMNTTYIDMYYVVHGLSDPSQLTDELRQWVENAKKKKLIRFTGFSAHKNMADNLKAAASLGWIDAAMASYNFRLMQDEQLRAAIEACHKAGVAVIAMKTLGLRTDHKVETEADKKIVEPFLSRGFTDLQANIKAVLSNEKITAACVGMNSVAHLASNAAAATDGEKLSQQDMDALQQYAKATCSGYCAGCANICDSALGQMPYVSDIMRYLMYYNSYGQKEMAKKLFAEIPYHVRTKLCTTDYAPAEKMCPQNLPIARLISEAAVKLA